tara:strand:+ start:826 stop:1104 length:279 start_codon:yes stop_codon:yes gene_type:complete
MAYKNVKGESMYLHGWLEADPGSKEFKPTTGGNSVWANTKREAIAKVNARSKAHQLEYPNSTQLRVDPSNCHRAKDYKESSDHSYGLYLMTI